LIDNKYIPTDIHKLDDSMYIKYKFLKLFRKVILLIKKNYNH
jgi:hypothetical protein